MELSRQEYWSGLPFPSLGDLPDPGVEPGSPALQADSLPLSHQGSSPKGVRVWKTPPRAAGLVLSRYSPSSERLSPLIPLCWGRLIYSHHSPRGRRLELLWDTEKLGFGKGGAVQKVERVSHRLQETCHSQHFPLVFASWQDPPHLRTSFPHLCSICLKSKGQSCDRQRIL